MHLQYFKNKKKRLQGFESNFLLFQYYLYVETSHSKMHKKIVHRIGNAI